MGYQTLSYSDQKRKRVRELIAKGKKHPDIFSWEYRNEHQKYD